MLKWSYFHFGFAGTIIFAFILFVFFIFYVAGLAGIVDQPNDPQKNTKIILAIIVPPYPIIWLFYDMYKQGKALKS